MPCPPLPPAPVLVVGVGNVLLGDDGVGVFLARELSLRPLEPGVEVVDGGTLGLGLLALLEGRKGLVLLDAVRGDGEPGQLHWVRWPLPASWARRRGLSPHEGSAWELLATAELTGLLPPEVQVGLVTVAHVSPGVGLSKGLQESFPYLVEAAEDFVSTLVRKLGAGSQGGRPRNWQEPPPSLA